MKSSMLPKDHQAAVQRALALGRSGDPAGLQELVAMLRLPSYEVQRLAASAIGKLVEFGADANLLELMRREIANAERALPLVDADARLGFHQEFQGYKYNGPMIRAKIASMRADLSP